MTWIHTVVPEEAEGRVKKSYDAAIARAGRVFGIVKALSPAPAIMDSALGLYQRVMFATEGLARYQRELIAVVVSRANDCHY